jgi:uncharacterized membrane protein YgdD (TMEM256/DUF423 family)
VAEVDALTGRRLAAFGASVAGLAVAAGAFGAHTLRDTVTPERLAAFETGARYALAHGIALLVLGTLTLARPGLGARLRRIGLLWSIGVAMFAGSLWGLVLLDLPVLGAVAPLGGVCLIGGWLWLAWTLWTARDG